MGGLTTAVFQKTKEKQLCRLFSNCFPPSAPNPVSFVADVDAAASVSDRGAILAPPGLLFVLLNMVVEVDHVALGVMSYRASSSGKRLSVVSMRQPAR
jgi:hypothetical protein